MRSAVVLIGFLAALPNAAAVAQQNVDTVVTNGKILTVDPDFAVVEALAIDDGRIVARGTSAEIARYAGPSTEVIDVAGATVIPGLIDNHFHFTRAVERWHLQARFEGVDSRREALAILAAKAQSLPPGEWIMVQGGWTPRQFADRPGGFTLEELDGVAPKNPLFVQEGYSFVYANTLALKAVGLDPADGAKRSAAGLASFQPPAKLLDAHAADVARAARAEPHGLHARAQCGRAHRRLQPGAITVPGDERGQRAAAGSALGELGIQRHEPRHGRRGRGAHRAHAPEPVRWPVRHLRPRRGALRAVLRSRAARRALARRDHERVRQARDRGGARRLARAPARDQQQRRHGSARHAGAGERDAAPGSPALDARPRLRHLAAKTSHAPKRWA